MRLVDVTAQGLLLFCQNMGVTAHMHPCAGAVILKGAPEPLVDLILDSCDHWDHDERGVYAYFKGWMCVFTWEGGE